MTEEKKKPDETGFDILIANSIYPNAESIFSTRPQPLEEIKDDCLIVLDTNALLVPYRIGQESLEQIRKTYKALTTQKRLIIPGQVAREFAKNRAAKLVELFQQLNRKANIPKLQKGKYPLLESLKEYQDATRLEDEIDKLLREYNEAINKVLDHIRSWAWNDPVSLLYDELVSRGVVFDPTIDREKALADLSRRKLHNIPPGYKDAEKDDKGIGDLLIWYAILETGKTNSKSIVFVSGDEKADWWHKSEGQSLYPRFELVDEFRRYSNGQSFHIIQFSRFLDLYGASETVVAEVQREERQIWTYVPMAQLANPREVIISIPTTGDKERDTRRLRRVYGLLTSYPGTDQFSFSILEHDGRKYQLRFPQETTGWCAALEGQLSQLLGPDMVEVRTTAESLPWLDDEIPLPNL